MTTKTKKDAAAIGAMGFVIQSKIPENRNFGNYIESDIFSHGKLLWSLVFQPYP